MLGAFAGWLASMSQGFDSDAKRGRAPREFSVASFSFFLFHRRNSFRHFALFYFFLFLRLTWRPASTINKREIKTLRLSTFIRKNSTRLPTTRLLFSRSRLFFSRLTTRYNKAAFLLWRSRRCTFFIHGDRAESHSHVHAHTRRHPPRFVEFFFSNLTNTTRQIVFV